jgi:hypothetical protein
VARKRDQDQEEAARRQEEEAAKSRLRVELQVLRDTDPGMSLLNAVEFITPDPGRRIALYRLCSPEDRNIRFNGMGQDDSCHLKIASLVANELAFLERRAKAEGFEVVSGGLAECRDRHRRPECPLDSLHHLSCTRENYSESVRSFLHGFSQSSRHTSLPESCTWIGPGPAVRPIEVRRPRCDRCSR